MSKSVVIADDHPIFRKGLVEILCDSTEFYLAGEAENGQQALELLNNLTPDIALLDISMPVMDGLHVVRAAKARGLECAFVILTMYRDHEYFREAMDLGILGYLLKEGAPGELMACLRTVAQGRHYIAPTMSEILVLRAAGQGNDSPPGVSRLSPTERRILAMIGAGKTSKEIAEDLSISHHTVNNHRSHICEKLRLEGPHKLLQFALHNKDIL